VDWEAAFLNDRYLDLAVVANFGVNSEADEGAFLQTYFGESAGEYRLNLFFLCGECCTSNLRMSRLDRAVQIVRAPT
jgi:thiamine kinase-like enzyme